MPYGYTTDPSRGRGAPLGYGVECDYHLAMGNAPDGRQDKVPYGAAVDAQVRLGVIERAGSCTCRHRVVKVWETYAKVRVRNQSGAANIVK